MTEFAKLNPVTNRFWAEVDDLSLTEAAFLTFNIDPFAPDYVLTHTCEPVTSEDLPDGFPFRIEALRSSIRTHALQTVALNYDEHMRIDENETRIKTDDFIAWCNAKRLPHNIPGRILPQTTKWPWGEYETKLLRELAAAADRFWKNYDPTDRTTAPLSKDVEAWLIGRGVADRTAEEIAKILRADGLPTGPRK